MKEKSKDFENNFTYFILLFRDGHKYYVSLTVKVNYTLFIVKRELIVLCGFLHFGCNVFRIVQIKEKEPSFPPLFLVFYLLLPFLHPNNFQFYPTYKSTSPCQTHVLFMTLPSLVHVSLGETFIVIKIGQYCKNLLILKPEAHVLKSKEKNHTFKKSQHSINWHHYS